MKKDLYVIEKKVYENHIDDEVHLYGLLHQLAFLAGKVKDAEDMAHLIDTAQRYGEIADEKFDVWNIPGRYLVFGDKKDLADVKAKELQKLSAVLAEHDREKAEKEKALSSWDVSYIIPGWSFRLLVGDIFSLLAMYGSLTRRIAAVKTEKELARLQKQVSGGNRMIQRMYRKWGVPEESGVTCLEMLRNAIEKQHLTPILPDEAEQDGFDSFPDVFEDE